jgi:hypothetical protein
MLSNPPIPGPDFAASSSVARVISHAAGSSANPATAKTTSGLTSRKRSAIATGMARKSR